MGWLLGFVVVKGAADVATVEAGSYWRLIMPALPAFVILSAAVPLLVPTLVDRAGPLLAPLPGRRPGLRSTVAVVAFVSIVPIAVLVASSPLRAVHQEPKLPPVVASAVVVDNIEVPVSGGIVTLHARRTTQGNELTWTDHTTRAGTFYRVYRGSVSRSFLDLVCELRGVDRCELRSETLVTTRAHRYVDTNPPPDAVYRIGVLANWVDDEARGDVFGLSPPAAP
jgi:hypothetical protein